MKINKYEVNLGRLLSIVVPESLCAQRRFAVLGLTGFCSALCGTPCDASSRREFHHPLVACVSDVNIAAAIDCHVGRVVKTAEWQDGRCC